MSEIPDAQELIAHGHTCRDRGQVERALAFYKQAEKAAKTERNQAAKFEAGWMLGVCYRMCGDTGTAIEYLAQSFAATVVNAGLVHNQHGVLRDLARAHEVAGRLEEANTYYSMSRSALRETDHIGLALTLAGHALVLLKLGKAENAEILLNLADETFGKAGNNASDFAQATLLIRRAQFYLGTEQPSMAEPMLNHARSLLDSKRYTWRLIECDILQALGELRVARTLEDTCRSAEHYSQSALQRIVAANMDDVVAKQLLSELDPQNELKISLPS